jgi:citrate lyase subunit beta/citryl-CoA lyase
MTKIGTAGNYNDKVRSDCKISLELTNSGGNNIELQSKVKKLYGNSILKLASNILEYFDIKNSKLLIQDKGALDFVIAARIEAAIKKIIKTQKEYLLEQLEQNTLKTQKDRFRLTRLYLPGNTPKLMINAGIHKPNGIILDLEDSVAPEKKFEARILVRNALRNVDFYGAERMVRINQLPLGIEDLQTIIPQKPNMILLPKCESAEQVKEIQEKIDQLKTDRDFPIWIMPIIESALGVEKAYEIATASPFVAALAIGLEDFTADLGVARTQQATESFYARTRIINACKAANIQPIDSVFSDISDMDALQKNVEMSKALGFEGMGCIHPRQIKIIHKAFRPSDEEIEKAKKIVEAFNEAQKKGLGVVALGSKMIDPPVVKRAIQTLKLIENE